jgi:hypothetical protein
LHWFLETARSFELFAFGISENTVSAFKRSAVLIAHGTRNLEFDALGTVLVRCVQREELQAMRNFARFSPQVDNSPAFVLSIVFH